MTLFLTIILSFQDGVEPTPLPVQFEGKGLAAKHRDISRAPGVVFFEPFENDRFKERWNDIKGPLSIVDGAVRMDYKRGDGTGGHLYKMLKPGYDQLFFRFSVKFPKGHGPVHHFIHLTGYNPPTSWPQGGAGERPKGNERFSTGIDVFNDWGRTPAPGRWGFYSYWCEMKASPDGKFWGNEPKQKGEVRIETDRWITVEVMVKCNTVGKADGEQAFWIDGKCAGRWGGYRWRTDPALNVNGVWLLYYITDDAVRRGKGELKDEHIFFDDVVVATEYIGPSK